MGCGNSKGASLVIPGDEPQEKSNSPSLTTEDAEENPSNATNTPDHVSEVVTPLGVSKPNGTSIPQLVKPREGTPIMAKKVLGKKDNVAFEVIGSECDGKSLIKKHPPKKFQKLEEIQITPEDLIAKQNSAKERRQKLINQRVQSAKTRSAKVRSINSANSNDTDENVDSVIESPEEL